MCVWFKEFPVCERTGSIKKKKKKRTGEECKGKVKKLNSAIVSNVGGTTDALEHTLHWTRIFNFVTVHFACTQRNFKKHPRQVVQNI